MALPSLGLGIGLQAELKDYSGLIQARERGKVAAQAKKRSEEERRLQKYASQIDMTNKKPMLKVHQDETEKEYLALMDKLYNAVDSGNANYNDITTSVSDYVRKVEDYSNQYQDVKRAQFTKGVGFDAEEIERLFNEPDPDKLNTQLSRPGSPFMFDPETKKVSLSVYSQTPVSEIISKAFSDPTIYTNDKGTVKIGGKSFYSKGINPKIVEATVNTITTDPNYSRSLDNEYWQYLKMNNQTPDISQEGWRDTFNQGRDEYLAASIAKQVEGRAKLSPVPIVGGGSRGGGGRGGRGGTFQSEVVTDLQIDNAKKGQNTTDQEYIRFSKSGGTANPEITFKSFEEKGKSRLIKGKPIAVGLIGGNPSIVVEQRTKKMSMMTGQDEEVILNVSVPWTESNKAQVANEYPELVDVFEGYFQDKLPQGWNTPDPTARAKSPASAPKPKSSAPKTEAKGKAKLSYLEWKKLPGNENKTLTDWKNAQ